MKKILRDKACRMSRPLCVLHRCVFLACVAALVSCGGKTKQDNETVKMVNVAECRDANELPPTSFTGLARSADLVNVAFRVSGTISRVVVKEGDYVKKGQLLAILDDRDYQVQLNATKAEYESVKADAERVIALYEDGSTTAQNYDKARYGLQQISQKLANHTNQLHDTRLVAPMAGFVRQKLRESGEAVAAGLPVMELSSSDRLEIEIDLPAKEFLNLNEYLDFYCTFNVTGAKRYPLKVVRTSVEANANQLYSVYLQFKDGISHKGVTAGMSAMVYGRKRTQRSSMDETGTVKDEEHDIIIPATSLVRDGNTTCVFVVDEKEGVVRQRTVKLVLINPDGTVTVSRGVSVGEKVVRTGAHSLSDGQKVEIMAEPSKTNVGGMI